MAEVESNWDIVACPFGISGLSLAVSADVEWWTLTFRLKVCGLAFASIVAEASVSDVNGVDDDKSKKEDESISHDADCIILVIGAVGPVF